MQFLRTLKESKTPSSSGSIGSPVSKFNPTTWPSVCSSCSAATVIIMLAYYFYSIIPGMCKLTSILNIVSSIGGQGLGDDEKSVGKGLDTPLSLALD